MFPRGNINQFSKEDLIQTVEFVHRCLSYSPDEPFATLFEKQPIIPCDYIVCGYIAFENNTLSQIIDIENVSYPKEWMDIYLENNYQSVDPILRTHISSFKPQYWHDTYKKHSDTDQTFLSSAQDFGLYDGITHGVLEPGDSTGTIFSFADTSFHSSNPYIEIVRIIVPHLHQAFIRLHRERAVSKKRDYCPLLSPREIEILNWIKAGKTNWEISMILSISERTVKFHVSNVLRKLDASTRGHALAKALEAEIIPL